MQATLQGGAITRTQLSLLRTEIQELIKYVALNYIAVVKAIKKRNRHLKVRAVGCSGTFQVCCRTPWDAQRLEHSGWVASRSSHQKRAWSGPRNGWWTTRHTRANMTKTML